VGSTGALIYGEFDNQLLRVNGNLNINGAYEFPTTAGSDGQVLKTNSAGVLSWQNDQGAYASTDTARILADIDGDTKIQVEESADENVLRFDVAGAEVLTITDTISTFKGTRRDLLRIKTLNNSAETGLAFQNTGSSYTWSIHRTGTSTPDLVFSGGNTPGNVDDLTERLRITKDGNVGIATDTFDYKFQVGNAGDGTEARANAWNTFSDRRWKTDFAVITNAIEKIEAIHGYYYKWKDRPDTTTQVGVIAQEIEAVLPEVVSTDAQGYKSVDYSKLTALLVQGMKEQQEMIQQGRQLNYTQQEVISQLKANQTTMQARLDSIESQFASTAQN
jgi:hypothetical protein